MVKRGKPLVLARCTRRRALVRHRTRRALVQQRTLLVLARCTRHRALAGAGAAQVPAGATYSITVSGAALAAVGECSVTGAGAAQEPAGATYSITVSGAALAAVGECSVTGAGAAQEPAGATCSIIVSGSAPEVFLPSMYTSPISPNLPKHSRNSSFTEIVSLCPRSLSGSSMYSCVNTVSRGRHHHWRLYLHRRPNRRRRLLRRVRNLHSCCGYQGRHHHRVALS